MDQQMPFIYVEIVYICVCFFSLAIAIPPLYFSLVSRSWSKVSGTIRLSNVEKRIGLFESVYHASVTYEYSVGQHHFKNSRVYFGFLGDTQSTLFSDKKLATKRIKNYHPDKDVIVFYNPKKPSQAVLEPGVHFSVIVCAFLILLGIFMLVQSILFAIKNT